MTTCIGCVLLFSVVAGGVYLYYKVERLDREISKQTGSISLEGEDEKR